MKAKKIKRTIWLLSVLGVVCAGGALFAYQWRECDSAYETQVSFELCVEVKEGGFCFIAPRDVVAYRAAVFYQRGFVCYIRTWWE